MIDEEYVSFETAKLAKQKGFFWPVCHYYLGVTKEVNNETVMMYDTPYPYNSTNKNFLSAPTQAVLAKWLRENYNMCIEVYSTAYGFIWCICDTDSGTDRYSSNDEGPNEAGAWDVYEEALEHALQYALCVLIG